MPNYTLTQTGQEVQDILDSMGATYFFSEVCSTWASDSTYADYPYKGTIPLVGVDGTMGVEVTFSMTDAISGNYSPICNTTNDAVEIWSKKNTSITIPTIKITKNGYVNLNGSSNYMPQSGGNFTGAISVNGSNVITQNDIAIQPITLTATASVNAIGTSTKAYKVGRLVVGTMYSQIIANVASGTDLIMGLPVPLGGSSVLFAINTNSGNYGYRAKVTTSGTIQCEGALGSSQSWYAGVFTYISAS